MATPDFDTIEIRDVRYMPSSNDNDILFILPTISMGDYVWLFHRWHG